jgi:DNA-binding MurR/RpiR family transcriptional regulator
MPVHNQIRGDDPMRLVGEKLIKENVAAMHATLDVNTEEKLLESVAMLRTRGGSFDRDWRVRSGGA